MKESKGFNLVSIIIIIFVTAIISGLTAGVIVTNNYGLSYGVIANDEKLSEFLKAYTNISEKYYEDINKEEMLDTALDAMLNYLGDNYTTYLNKGETEELNELLSGTYEGIGITFKDRIVENTIKSSSAQEAGIKEGDEIVKINGIDVTNYDDNTILAMIKANKDKKIDVTVKSNNIEKSYSLEFKEIIKPSIDYHMVEETNIGYLKINIFSKTLTEQVTDALNSLKNKGMEKLIIDVRDNSGGYLDTCEAVANMFLKKDQVVYSLEDKDGTVKYLDKTDEYTDYPIVILINEKSASASEILAAALKDNYGAKLVGTTSYGKGKVQQTYDLEDGSKAKFTSAKWLRPNGTCIDGVGLQPDFEVKNAEETNTYDGKNEVDSQLDTAVQIISTM